MAEPATSSTLSTGSGRRLSSSAAPVVRSRRRSATDKSPGFLSRIAPGRRRHSSFRRVGADVQKLFEAQHEPPRADGSDPVCRARSHHRPRTPQRSAGTEPPASSPLKLTLNAGDVIALPVRRLMCGNAAAENRCRIRPTARARAPRTAFFSGHCVVRAAASSDPAIRLVPFLSHPAIRSAWPRSCRQKWSAIRANTVVDHDTFSFSAGP